MAVLVAVRPGGYRLFAEAQDAPKGYIETPDGVKHNVLVAAALARGYWSEPTVQKHSPGGHGHDQSLHGRRGAGAGPGYEDLSPAVAASLKRVEDRIVNIRNKEEVHVIDPADGVVINSKSGPEKAHVADGQDFSRGVQLEGAELTELRGKVVTHNHPGYWDYPEGDPARVGSGFSVDDIRLAAKANVAELRAVSPDFINRLRPGKHGWPSDLEVRDAANAMEGVVRKEFWAKIGAGEFTKAEAGMKHSARKTELMTEALDIRYDRVPR